MTCFLNVLGWNINNCCLRSCQSLSRSPDGIGDFLSNQKAEVLLTSIRRVFPRSGQLPVGKLQVALLGDLKGSIWFLLTLKCPCNRIHQRNAQCSNSFFFKNPEPFGSTRSVRMAQDLMFHIRPRSVSSFKWFRSLDWPFCQPSSLLSTPPTPSTTQASGCTYQPAHTRNPSHCRKKTMAWEMDMHENGEVICHNTRCHLQLSENESLSNKLGCPTSCHPRWG